MYLSIKYSDTRQNTNMETLKTVLDISSGLLFPLIAILTAYIAYQQHKTNKNRLRFELYDKRFEIYLSVKTLISQIVMEANISRDRALQFAIETREAEFLFDKEIFDYLNEIYKKALELHAIHIQHELLSSEDKRAELNDRIFKLVRWFDTQVEVVSEKFSKYLSLKDLS